MRTASPWLAGAVVGGGGAFAAWRRLRAIAPSATGFVAKTMASAVFVSARAPDAVWREELAGINPVLRLTKVRIDRTAGHVCAHLLGLAPQQAVFREGRGCTLVDRGTTPLPAFPSGPLAAPAFARQAAGRGLDAVVDRAFDAPGRKVPLRTRALLVMQDGRLVVERYGTGVTADTPLCGQSLSKTVTGALAGILVGRGLLDPDAPAPVPQWRDPADPRRDILLRHLLTMTSGLRWDENAGNPQSDVVRMLFRSRDMASFAAACPLRHTPGSLFHYNSGATNILSRILLTALGDDRAAYAALPRDALFGPARMAGTVFEADAAGTFVGSTSVYATARDWARFGALYLDDGVLDGVRVLPRGWVATTATPAPAAPNGCYGVQLWLNAGSTSVPAAPRPTLPSDLMLMNGRSGQFVAVVPSRAMVIVRLGETRDWRLDTDPDRLIAELIEAIPAA